ncbi:protein MET1, chloroplastic [Amaranthus tricolor]|uniref:protein MET1, chloroplastic n=1 Tax=Amaranthus tricolor TaxID=29722 RepID=UPI002589BE7F|nr:protein MET1, chloroplastic [Amaranthus tricolor]XP_057550417.1 protein MET1, chloroplastic [Amaranthus tricolor]
MMSTTNSCGYGYSQAQLYHCSYQALDQTNRSHLQLFKTRQFGLSSVAAASPTRFLVGYRCSCRSNKSLSRFVIKATETDSSSSNQEEEEKYEEYEVEIERPFGLKFAKGRDGAVYIDAIAPGLSADKTGKFTVGDKVIATSAMFGTEIWPAAEYGRTMYTIRQRIGPLYMKMLKRYGNLDYASGEMTEKEIIRAERNAGFISNRIREIQLQNYQRKMAQKERREQELREGLQLYKMEKYDEAREKFESVLGSSPTATEASVANYNVACCYSKLNQIQAGLSALEDALEEGYEDFNRIRTDPDLANLRTADEFETLLKRFDESFINENAVNAIKSLFGIFNKK